MLYHYFTGSGNVTDLAWTIAKLIFAKFNPAVDIQRLVYSLITRLRVLYESFNGSFSWSDVAGILLDIGQLIMEFLPAGKLYDVIAVLWNAAWAV